MNRQLNLTKNGFAACPCEGKIRAFYASQFESVYVLLHPFIKPHGLDIARFCPETWPCKQEIMHACDPISWQEILSITHLSSLADIDVGLRTLINGLQDVDRNVPAADQLNALLQSHHVLCPGEGELSPLLENRLFAVLKSLGWQQLCLSDEFGIDIKMQRIDDLMADDLVPSHACLFTEDHRILLTTHWDSHCSFLCASKDIIEKILATDPFEGFYCTEDTEVYWGLYA